MAESDDLANVRPDAPPTTAPLVTPPTYTPLGDMPRPHPPTEGADARPTEPAALDRIRADVSLLRDQVDVLQSVRESKPWYRQHSLLVSGLALLVSTVLSISARRDQTTTLAAAERKGKLETLRQYMGQLADIRMEETREFATSGRNAQLYSQLSSLRQTKRQLLIESADAIIVDVEGEVQPNILVTLAFEQTQDGRYAEAKRFYELAEARTAPGSPERLVVAHGMAGLKMIPGTPVFDADAAMRHFDEGEQILRKRSDEYGRFMLTQHFMQQAGAAYFAQRRDLAARSLARAFGELETLSSDNPSKVQLRAMLDTLARRIAATNRPVPLPNALSAPTFAVP
jgi:hypothetical protein